MILSDTFRLVSFKFLMFASLQGVTGFFVQITFFAYMYYCRDVQVNILWKQTALKVFSFVFPYSEPSVSLLPYHMLTFVYLIECQPTFLLANFQDVISLSANILR